ncbi:hypothetical protein HK103_001799 [Boothiomyces macroporosus]|uniref:Glycosyl transferase family 25 domain-containing protein n=1 Tax=Boothiomyces macroporosus TaxID=261099 RepID=A0AAD5UA22_9FUNG|nr:hypothetical protein HK103_001799 [Boothiomyces macroporosus]
MIPVLLIGALYLKSTALIQNTHIPIHNNRTEVEFKKPELKYPPPSWNVELAFDTQLFPSPHIGYTLQNGPEIIKRTYARQNEYIDIMIDPILEPDFNLLYKDGFCPSKPECKFSYTSDLDHISNSADAFITNQRKGLLARDAALHFTKTVFLTSKEQKHATGRWLRDQEWYGTDIFASFDRIPANYQGELFARPKFFPVHKTKITKEQLTRPIQFFEKIPFVTMIVEDSYCSEWTNKYHIYKLSKQISPYLPIAIFPTSCRLKFSSTALDKKCGNDIDCFIKYSTTTILIDTHFDDNFIVEPFWKSISFGTPVMYFWRHSFFEYIPEHTTYHMQKLEIEQDEIKYLLSMSDHEGIEFAFKWKNFARNSTVISKMERVVDYSIDNFPCRLCEHVAQKKQSVKCMLDLFKEANTSTIQSVNNFLNPDQQINGLGPLANTFDAVDIAHYSKSAERREHMQDLMLEMNVEGRFIMGFDKQAVTPEAAFCMVEGRVPQGNELEQYKEKLTPGEISLAVKDYYAMFNILSNNYTNTLILEDDVKLFEDADPDLIEEIMKYIPPNYSIVQLGQCLDAVLDGFDSGIRRHGFPRQIVANLGDWRHCTSAFVASKTGALILFKAMPLSSPIDHQMMAAWIDGREHGSVRNPDYSVYGVWPTVFVASEEVNEKSSTGIRPGEERKKPKDKKKKPN